MKTLRLLSLLLILAVVACKNRSTVTPNPAPKPDLNATAQTDPTSWSSVALNSTYTIKFPVNYTGPGGRLEIDGWLFAKDRGDKRAKFGYAFCTPTGCNEYGPIVLGGKAVPASVTFKGQTLSKSIAITENGETVGQFFYSEQATAIGVLYLSTNFQFRESLNVEFDNALQAEIFAIIRTIRQRV